MNNLIIRIISAVVLTALCFGGLVWNLYSRWLVITLLLVLGSREFSRMVFHKFSPTLRDSLTWISALFAFLLLLNKLPLLASGLLATGSWTWLIIIAAVFLYVMLGFTLVSIENMAPWIFLNIISVLFSGLWASRVFAMTNDHPGFAGVTSFVLVVICVATADTGAYFSGRVFGKHKLCPTISPNKTIEGLAGGTLLVVMVSSFLGPVLTEMGGISSIGFGLFISATSAAGDLIFSAFKRYTGIKDTSNIIPGHGGVLDRFDALFFSIPFAALYFDLISFYG